MRRNLFLIIILYILNLSLADSQIVTDSKREFNLGYGFISDVEIYANLAELNSEIFSGISGEPESSDYKMTGPFITSCKFRLSKKITAGPELNILQLDMTNKYTTGDVYNYHFFLAILSGRLDVRYTENEITNLYSSLSIGASYIHYKSSDVTSGKNSAFIISYQLNFIGIRVGKKWGGFAEFGFGRNGLLNIGVSGRF